MIATILASYVSFRKEEKETNALQGNRRYGDKVEGKGRR